MLGMLGKLPTKTLKILLIRNNDQIPVLESRLVWSTGKNMASRININNGIKDPIHGYQNRNTSQVLIFGGSVKMRESLCTQVSVWVNTILNHIDTRKIFPWYEGSCTVYRPEWYE
jgi:hypothetical protein